ncbi:MAG: CBO0543 family protein [Sporomusaceae bacterium]|nr:CBO0543 family protein [Sporomusaceae bacterium]
MTDGLIQPRTVILLFRIGLLAGFLLAAWRWSDWRRWQRYYPTLLFVMVANLAAGYITYHHPLWDFNADTLAVSETTVELLNTFVLLPTATLVYLSNYPAAGPARQARYILAWIALFATIETADTIVGGISYFNGWSLAHSVLFDCVMFPIVRLHHLRPPLAWLASLAVALYILVAFGFFSAEMK